MVSTVVLFVAATIVSIAIGATIPPMWKSIQTWGKTPYICVNPRSRGIRIVWRNAANPGTVTGRDGREAEIVQDSRHIHGYGNKRAYLVNESTGSTLVLNGDEGRFLGLDGVSLYMQHRDGRVADVQNSGKMDLETLAKYGMIAVVVLGVMLLAVLGILVSGLQKTGGA